MAAERLAKDGIEVDVINARFAAPVDKKILSLAEAGKGIITVEDHNLSCGFGSALLELAAERTSDSKRTALIRMLGAPRILIGQDSRKAQLMQTGISADKIVKTARKLVSGN